jgi:hypothetical protein
MGFGRPTCHDSLTTYQPASLSIGGSSLTTLEILRGMMCKNAYARDIDKGLDKVMHIESITMRLSHMKFADLNL